MSTELLYRHIEQTDNVMSGKPRIVGRRITVQNIVIWHERMGKSPDEIGAEHSLTLAEVYAALSYYFDHREEIEKEMQQTEAYIAELRAKRPSALAQKLSKLSHD